MTLHPKSVAATAALACACWAGAAHAELAESPSWVLEGNPADIVVINFTAGLNQFTQGRLALSGFGDPVTLEQGDSFSATVAILEGPLVVPGSVQQFIGFDLEGLAPPAFDDSEGADVVLLGEVSFFLEGALMRSGAAGCGNCSFVALFQSPGESFAFDEITVSGQFMNLTSPYTIGGASFTYQLSQPIPEPATWALWLAGLGMAGVSARRRRAARSDQA